MNSGASQNIVIWQYALNASWVLLPLVPAVLIYLIFPKTEVGLSGPFSGLTIRASGAFGAYFIVLLATMPLLNRQNHNLETLLRPTWVITGTVHLQDEDGRELAFNNRTSPLTIDLDPKLVEPRGPKGFRVIVPEVGDHQVPALFIRFPGYADYMIDPTSPNAGDHVKIDAAKKSIDITSPIILRKQKCVGIGCDQAA